MDGIRRQQRVQEARDYWDDEQPFQAGRVLFESIPVETRHLWAYNILHLAYPYFPRDCKIEAVLEFAKDPMRWGSTPDGNYEAARSLVDAVNGCQLDPLILRLAAQAGKIAYTAQQFPSPFDHFSGWKIATVLWQIVHQARDYEFTTQAWSTLANAEFILLEEPVMCHPDCPTCGANGLAALDAGLFPGSVHRSRRA